MKNKPLLLFASIISAFYIFLVFFLFTHNCPGYPKYALPVEANELGDLLAGVFSPLAFLWLIVGYFLQASELSLTRKELNRQTIALNDQVQATSRAVELEAEYQRERKKNKDKMAAPILEYNGLSKGTQSRNPQLSIKNRGGSITSVNVKVSGRDIPIDEWLDGKMHHFTIDNVDDTFVDDVKGCSYNLELKYIDMFKQQQRKRYVFSDTLGTIEEI
jgi:hypothetical protein